jgi:hypothetical protein
MSRTREQMKEARKLLKKMPGKFEKVDLSKRPHPLWMSRCYKNNRYMVMIDDNVRMSDGSTGTKAMIQRHDDAVFPDHWRELQNIKNEIFGREAVAIEYFPAESELSDRANIYWLFILPADSLPLPVEA